METFILSNLLLIILISLSHKVRSTVKAKKIVPVILCWDRQSLLLCTQTREEFFDKKIYLN